MKPTDIVDLEFYNVDANPSITRLKVSRASINPIMDWYDAYCAGDDYGVQVDGVDVFQSMAQLEDAQEMANNLCNITSGGATA